MNKELARTTLLDKLGLVWELQTSIYQYGDYLIIVPYCYIGIGRVSVSVQSWYNKNIHAPFEFYNYPVRFAKRIEKGKDFEIQV